MSNHYLVADTETGGLDPSEHSIMSFTGVSWRPGSSKLIFDFLINEGGRLNYTWTAMGVNGIQIADVVNKGLSPNDAVSTVRRALDAAFGEDRDPVILAGHNISFDALFVRRLYWLAGEDFTEDFSHRTLDTASILLYKMLQGDLPESAPNSNYLFELAEVEDYYSQRHTSTFDALATAEALTRLVSGAFKIHFFNGLL